MTAETRPAHTREAVRSLARHLGIDVERVEAASPEQRAAWIQARNNGESINKDNGWSVRLRQRGLDLDNLR